MSQSEKTPLLFAAGDRMSITIVAIFAAVCNSDSQEGKGSQVDHSYHLTELAATIATSKIGVMGSDGKVEPRLAICFGGGHYALLSDEIEIDDNPEAQAKLREQALKKLSPAELAALRGKMNA